MVVNDCSESRKKLQWKVFDWLTKQHPTSGVMVTAAMPVAYVEEVTALHICSSYKGTVIVHRGYHVGKDCTRCDGVDRIKQVLAHDGVWNSVCQHLDSLVPKSFTCSTMTSIWGWLIFCTQKREVLLSYALQFKIQMRV